MFTFAELQEKINDSISNEKIGREPYSLYDPINYTLESGGKRIRPVLVLMACNLFSDDIEHAIKPAIGLEIFHNFTLLHDDIMDHADIRRGNPTVHKKWNENTAILSGDAMFIKAYEYFLGCESPNFREILKVFNNTALEVCEGQQYDMEFEDRESVTEQEYLRMIELKTSVLLAAALKIGALLGGADKNDADLLYEFGRNIGLAFQLQDDFLDVYGDTNVFGKQIGGDIVANKKTFMLIMAKELAKGEDKNRLNDLMLSGDLEREMKVAAVTEIYSRLDIRNIVQKRIEELNQKALEFLSRVSVAENKKSELKKLAEKLINRIN
ncbi:MAG: polyprenyl synthetase family protein [Bacteroidales bacterium]|nr:polyprenyl synthetase family protein [Bacteroidales bacterium]